MLEVFQVNRGMNDPKKREGRKFIKTKKRPIKTIKM